MGVAATDFATGAGPIVGTLPVRLAAAGYYLISEALSAGPTSNLIDARRLGFISSTNGAFLNSSQIEDEMLWYQVGSGTLDFSLVTEWGTPAVLNGGLLVVQCVLCEGSV